MVEVTELQVSSRDPEALRRALEGWLATQLAPDAAPRVPHVGSSNANGQSTETLLFEAVWDESGVERHEALVARIAPDTADVPVFPSYDLHRQHEAIRLAAEVGVPVPRLWWEEPDPGPLGAPFFVMSRVDGEVPPDVMPYTFGDSWVSAATDAERRRLQDATVEVLATVHAVAADEPRASFLALGEPGATPLARHLAHTRAWYDFATAGTGGVPILERTFRWLEDNLPADEGPAVVSWGDARIGNVIYRSFEPVAVLDWEMAAVGPRELDVMWLVNAHRVFQDLAQQLELPGLPDFLRWEDVATEYERRTGHTCRHLRWHGTYCGLQWGIVFLRTGQRAVHFGERPPVEDLDELIMNKPSIDQMLAGTYWEG